ncbi:hypothetical protein UFOVP923_39 [uncultured Caudovirales phage]|uniref:Uncharacterized protein n=1 Tax=uncultured Caudovirales phage TaxID=2100421 RepID=A0A6J5PSC5_9CAUD|nr:hypothetical protein UFOVP923_39 [uncultured Caudovirales phage]
MNTFTVTITDAEYKALAFDVLDPQDWIENAVHERCRVAMEEIFKQEVARMLADPETTSIPADREAVVLAADIKTAAQIQAEQMIPMIESAPTPPI